MTAKTEALLCLEYAIKWLDQNINLHGAFRAKAGLEKVQDYILEVSGGSAKAELLTQCPKDKPKSAYAVGQAGFNSASREPAPSLTIPRDRRMLDGRVGDY